jgi:hypothetical protein
VPAKGSGKPQKRDREAAPRGASPLPKADVKADRYIADQLKAMYDAVVEEPIPDRLMQLLDRLDGDSDH